VNITDRIYVAGHRGLVGSAIVRCLTARGYHNIVVRSKEALDLRDTGRTDDFFCEEQIEYVFLAAAVVGGIGANVARPAVFIEDNLAVQLSVIGSAWAHHVKKLLFLGSSCVYPRECTQPIREEYLLTGPLEPTNRPYAVAKIAGIEMLAAYKDQYGFASAVAMPTNLYGPNDNYDLSDAHVLPALIRRFHEAKVSGAAKVTLWGDGSARREFLHVDDCAEACVELMVRGEGVYNVGHGTDQTIESLAEIVAKAVGYQGEIAFDRRGPNGTPQKLLDSSKMRLLGWEPKIGLEYGVACAYQSFLAEGT
jgi:GDP-L-fucose synthase